MSIEVSAYYECTDCRNRWEVPFTHNGTSWEAAEPELLERCPRCGSAEINNVSAEAGES
jgi:hypothetical protein